MRGRTPILVLLLTVTFAAGYRAQPMQTAGTHFVFAVPEGADNISTEFLQPSQLYLIIIGQFDGTGVVYSPSGVEIPFTFSSRKAAQIDLPYSLMHLKDLGKTKKGVIVHTTQPVNVTLYMVQEFASEATQIFPVEATGTDYNSACWGLWNDIGEDNRSQILVTTGFDGTSVTITPTVDCLGGYKANTPITIGLNKGECFIIKADMTSLPATTSLTGTKISSSKPVSVMSAVTCAYVPLSYQACNPLLDHILPESNAIGTEFYACPPSSLTHPSTLVFLSRTPSFYVISSDGLTYSTTTGRLEVQLNAPSKYISSEPATVQMYTAGTELYYFSDPSMAPVLPVNQWRDTLLWFAPSILTRYGYLVNYLSVIYPTDRASEVLFDNKPITSFGQTTAIGSTGHSATVLLVDFGVHKLTSPVNVFAMSSGFQAADAFFFVTGSTGWLKPTPPDLPLVITHDSVFTCQDFRAVVSLPGGITKSDDIHLAEITITYDKTLLTPQQINVDPLIAPIAAVKSTAGTITITLSSASPIIIQDNIVEVIFTAGTKAVKTSIVAALRTSQLEYTLFSTRNGTAAKEITLMTKRKLSPAALSIVMKPSVLGDTTSGILYLESLPKGSYSGFRIRLRYNHDLITLLTPKLTSTIIPGWEVTLNRIDDATDELIYTSPNNGDILPTSGIIGWLRAMTYVTDTNATEIFVSGDFLSAEPCPLDASAGDTSTVYIGSGVCGDDYIQSFLKTLPLQITSVIPMPIRTQYQVSCSYKLPRGTRITFALVSQTGSTLWSEQKMITETDKQDFYFTIPPGIASGTYVLTASANDRTVSKSVIIEK